MREVIHNLGKNLLITRQNHRAGIGTPANLLDSKQFYYTKIIILHPKTP